jgi:hypothetical protein
MLCEVNAPNATLLVLLSSSYSLLLMPCFRGGEPRGRAQRKEERETEKTERAPSILKDQTYCNNVKFIVDLLGSPNIIILTKEMTRSTYIL